MAVELLTFGMFLLGHAWGWRAEPEAFRASQLLLHPDSALRGTVLLLLGSGLAYQAVLTHAEARRGATVAWLLAATVAGLAFTVNKVIEYGDPALADITLSTNAFWFSYLFLTGLHLLHVLLGVVVLPLLAWWAHRGTLDTLTLEAGAAYWHLVDIVWVVLFPLLYLMHP